MAVSQRMKMLSKIKLLKRKKKTRSYNTTKKYSNIDYLCIKAYKPQFLGRHPQKNHPNFRCTTTFTILISILFRDSSTFDTIDNKLPR